MLLIVLTHANWLQLLAAAITLLNNLTADEDMRLSVVNQLSMDKRNLQVSSLVPSG